MAIYRWEAGRDLLFAQERMSELFERALGDLRLALKTPPPWMPPCDIYEDDASFFLKIEVPGVSLENVFMEINDRSVLLVGERKRDRETSRESYIMVERGYGRFMRSFVLPGPVKENEASASLRDGVLTVIIPKKDRSGRSRTIKVDAG
ncbi:MAG: Hsp20/alpha crystallin family protein [Candidatus Nitrospinota bacterium M3_3B_026]